MRKGEFEIREGDLVAFRVLSDNLIGQIVKFRGKDYIHCGEYSMVPFSFCDSKTIEVKSVRRFEPTPNINWFSTLTRKQKEVLYEEADHVWDKDNRFRTINKNNVLVQFLREKNAKMENEEGFLFYRDGEWDDVRIVGDKIIAEQKEGCTLTFYADEGVLTEFIEYFEKYVNNNIIFNS